MSKRSQLIINLPRLIKNYNIFKSSLKSGQKIMAIVKANAYGHGDSIVSKVLEKAGCKDFGVATLEEALKLRKTGIKGAILILGYTPAKYAKVLVDNNIHQTVVCEEHLRELIKTNLKVAVHFKIDTGMNRIGFKPNSATEKLMRYACKYLDVKGIFTHLCVADDINFNNFTFSQINKFKRFVHKIKDLNLEYVHCYNSAGTMYYNDGFSTHARMGIALYGLKPDSGNALPKGVLPILEWRAEISMVKTIKKGCGVGYGLTFIAKKDMKIATVTTGYCDGYSVSLSNKGTIYVNGVKTKVVGRVCMDQLMIDVTSIPVKMGDEAVLLCDKYTANDMAKDAGTISYEIVTRVSSRVKRTYIVK